MLKRLIQARNIIFRRNVSALFVTGDKAMENFTVLTPHLEIDERLKDFNEIKENVSRRKLRINLDDILTEYKLFQAINARKKELENRRVEVAKSLKEKELNSEALKLEGKNLREDLKKLKENSYVLEDQFVHSFLSLPNFIHDKTPTDDEKEVIYSFSNTSTEKQLNSKIDELIEFFDPTCYYMKGEAAKFDLFTPLQVCDTYKEAGYIKFSNPDFVRSIIPEAAGYDPEEFFLLKEEDIENKLNLLHLTGNASILNYLPFIAKLVSFPTQFPLKFINTGKIYNQKNHYDHNNLYDVVQSTSCQVFVASKDSSSFDEIINEQIILLKKIYEPFNQHFRIVSYPAHLLSIAESYKIGIEMFSTSQQKYIEVGNFSYYSDFISKRLLFNYKEGRDYRFPHIFAGNIMNVMRLLVNLIECNKNLLQ